MNNHDEEESYLVPAEQTNEAVWCKIGDDGELAHVDWNIIKQLADAYDKTMPSERTDKILIGKLMWLARQNTIKEFSK